jgi:mRNA interferase RelE/StbE
MQRTPWRVESETRAEKDLDHLPDETEARIRAALVDLARDPSRPGLDVLKLQGQAGTFRLRVGQHRALYIVDRPTRTLRVLRVRDRKDAY